MDNYSPFHKVSRVDWMRIKEILKERQIPYTTHWKQRVIKDNFGDPITIDDKYFEINLVIPDYFGDEEALPW